MKLLELITNCINYTTQDDEDLNPSTLERYKNSTNYKAFIKNALPEINRAIQEVVAWKKLPLQVMEFVNSSNVENDASITVANPFAETNSLLKTRLKLTLTAEEWNKIYRIYKLEIEDVDGREYSPVEYKRLGDKLRVPYFNGTLYIHYYPRIRILTNADKGTLSDEDDEYNYNATDNSLELTTIGLDDTLCSIVIPCLVKANIWQEVEPELAQLERNKGLQNLNMLYEGAEEPYQTNVANTHSWGD